MTEQIKETNIFEDLFRRLKEYLSSQLELLRLKSLRQITGVLSSLILAILMVLIGFLVLVFLSLGVALYLSAVIGVSYAGFFIVGGFYLFAGVVLVVFKKKILKVPLSNWLVKNLLG